MILRDNDTKYYRLIFRGSGMLFLFFGLFQVIQIMETYEIDRHWTPVKTPLPYAEAASRFEVYIGGQQLKTLLAQERVFIRNEEGLLLIPEDNVKIRLNHAEKKVQRHQIIAAIFLTLGIFSLLLGLIPQPGLEPAPATGAKNRRS